MTKAMKYLWNSVIYASLLWSVGLAAEMRMSAAPEQSGHLADETYRKVVTKRGNISLPEYDRHTWAHLGSWLVADKQSPGYGFHDVYTQKGVKEVFERTGDFPDGAILIKEVNEVLDGHKTTGFAQWSGEPIVWFVMIKDTKGRFKDNPHWRDGWGWALFENKPDQTDPELKNVSASAEKSCLACHAPARATDWVFIEGYPGLRSR